MEPSGTEPSAPLLVAVWPLLVWPPLAVALPPDDAVAVALVAPVALVVPSPPLVVALLVSPLEDPLDVALVPPVAVVLASAVTWRSSTPATSSQPAADATATTSNNAVR